MRIDLISGHPQKAKGKRRPPEVFFSPHCQYLMGWAQPTPVTYINYGIRLDIVHAWILQPELFALSPCGADNACRPCVLQWKQATQGHHELASSQVRWLSQQQYRKFSLHVGEEGPDGQIKTGINQHLYTIHIWHGLHRFGIYNARITHPPSFYNCLSLPPYTPTTSKLSLVKMIGIISKNLKLLLVEITISKPPVK